MFSFKKTRTFNLYVSIGVYIYTAHIEPSISLIMGLSAHCKTETPQSFSRMGLCVCVCVCPMEKVCSAFVKLEH